MEKDENEFGFLNMILQDFLTKFCHCCIENICNEALKSIYKLDIEPEKMASCYLMFLREKILNTEIECKFRSVGCNDRIMFGEMRHHLKECKYNPQADREHGIVIDTACEVKNPSDLLCYNDLTICSSSSSIINKSCKKVNKKKKTNKKY